MKVILLQDVARTGRKHDVVDVPDGHAQNHLIPQRLAEPATAQNLKRVEDRAAQIESERAATSERFQTFIDAVDSKPVVIEALANEKGHLFKGLKAGDIATALTRAVGTTIPSSAIQLASPIKETGEHTIVVRMGDDERRLTLTVVSS